MEEVGQEVFIASDLLYQNYLREDMAKGKYPPYKATELNQWVAAEKKQLAAVMERHGIEWEQKGIHEKHLSVLDFEKQERKKEVEALEKAISGGKDELQDIQMQQTTAK